MTDDTTAAMDHLRESCAIAAGKVPPPPAYRPEVDPFKRADDAQVTCWATGTQRACGYCFNLVDVVTDGRGKWTNCALCGTVTTFP